MDKCSKLIGISEEIASAVKSLEEEMTDVESLFLNMNVIECLKKENEELERTIENYVKELEELEIGGRKQMYPVLNVVCKRDDITPVADQDGRNIVRVKQEIKTERKESKKVEKQELTNKKDKKGSCKNSTVLEEALPLDIGRLDLKVGRIVEIKKHDDADSLYVEKIDIGGEEPITVVSGLVKHVPLEEMKNRLVIVLCNLKPAKMRGVLSEGMVMCASTPEKVELLTPSLTSKPGDLVTIPGYPPPPSGPEPVLNPKKKIFETLAPELLTDQECFATFRGVRWEVPGGFVKSSTLSRVNIK